MTVWERKKEKKKRVHTLLVVGYDDQCEWGPISSILLDKYERYSGCVTSGETSNLIIALG